MIDQRLRSTFFITIKYNLIENDLPLLSKNTLFASYLTARELKVFVSFP